MNPLYWFATLQTLVTVSLVIFLWSLSSKLPWHSVYTWWTAAWTSYAVYLVVGTLALPLTPVWSPGKTFLIVLAAMLGYLPSVLLVFGARSVEAPGRPAPRWRLWGPLLVIPAGALTVLGSLAWTSALSGLFARVAPRTAALAIALTFCTRVFLRQWRRTRSRASLLIALVCLFYAATEGLYALRMFDQLAGMDWRPRLIFGPSVQWRSAAFLADVVFLYGTCLGLLLLFIEEYEQSQRALRESVDHRRLVTGENQALQQEIETRRRAEIALTQVEARHHAVLRALPDWMFVLSNDGVYLDAHVRNPEQLLARPEQFLGKHMTEVLPPDLAAAFMRCFAQVLKTDEISTHEYTLPRDGVLQYYEARLVRCERDTILCVVRDISERKRVEQQARDLADELAHVGRVTTLAALTGSLAHEIRQPLAAIMTNAQAAIRLTAATPPDLAELRAALADIVSDNQRAADVVQRLRTLLRKEPVAHGPVDLNDSVEEVVKVLQRDVASKRIALALQLQPALPPVLGDRVQIQQVVLNLLMNAFDAVEDGGPASRSVRLTTSEEDGAVRLAVSDRGVGLADDQLAQMFEPFHTTKPGGMGLGLAICHTIVAGHDGAIGFERHVDGGTTFAFTLPALSLRPDS